MDDTTPQTEGAQDETQVDVVDGSNSPTRGQLDELLNVIPNLASAFGVDLSMLLIANTEGDIAISTSLEDEVIPRALHSLADNIEEKGF